MDLTKTQLTESVFAGGGEMGARMLPLDWYSTNSLRDWDFHQIIAFFILLMLLGASGQRAPNIVATTKRFYNSVVANADNGLHYRPYKDQS